MADGKQETLAEILSRVSDEAKPKPVKELPPERKARLEGDNLEELIRLKRFYGRWILIMMAFVQIVSVVYVITRSLFPPEGME